MNIAVILAAGKGSRVKHTDRPKQFVEIGGKSILFHTVEKFIACKQIDHIVIAVNKDWVSYTEKHLAGYMGSRISVCEGADDRQETLYKALLYCCDYLKASGDTVIISHDAVRPFVTDRIIKDGMKAIDSVDAVNTVIPSIDTIIQSEDGKSLSGVPDRHHMYQVQTPQIFRLGKFIDIYRTLDRNCLDNMTDAVGILFRNGCSVHLVRGEHCNFKITDDYDMDVAGYLLKKN